jgi:hypothetical protein
MAGVTQYTRNHRIIVEVKTVAAVFAFAVKIEHHSGCRNLFYYKVGDLQNVVVADVTFHLYLS